MLRHELGPFFLASPLGTAVKVDNLPVDSALLGLELGDDLHEQARLRPPLALTARHLPLGRVWSVFLTFSASVQLSDMLDGFFVP